MRPREAFAKRLEQRVRAIVREELIAAGYTVDNPGDNPSPIVGGYRGGESNLENGGITPIDSPRFRNVRARRGGQTPALSELELLRGYGLDPLQLEEESR